MKNLFYIAGLVLAMGLTLTSCDKEPEYDQFSSDGAVPVPAFTADGNGFFDGADIANAFVKINLDVFTQDNPYANPSNDISVNSVDIYKSFNGSAPIFHASVAPTYPQVLTLTPADVTAGLGVLPADLVVGDVFTLTYKVNTSVGELTNGVSTSIPVSCPSNLAGTYDVLGEVIVGDFGPETNNYTVDLVSLGGGTYQFVGDASSGLWSGSYATAYGAAAREPELYENCGVVTVQTISDQFGGDFQMDPAQPAPTYDPATGVIVFYWNATAYGEQGKMTMTPQ